MSIFGGIEVGRSYRDGNGDTVKIAFETKPNDGYDDDHPFIGFNKNKGTWDSFTVIGHYDCWSVADEDLKEEVESYS